MPLRSGGNLKGDGTYVSPSYTPTESGTYNWKASYSGSLPNTLATTHNDGCDDPAESVTLTSVPSTLSSAQAWVPNDAVTVSAPNGGDLAGTVSFALYASPTCSGTPLYTGSAAVAGASPQTVSSANTTAVTASGTYSWSVSYDSANPAQRDIAASCHETSDLTITNGGQVSSS